MKQTAIWEEIASEVMIPYREASEDILTIAILTMTQVITAERRSEKRVCVAYLIVGPGNLAPTDAPEPVR